MRPLGDLISMFTSDFGWPRRRLIRSLKKLIADYFFLS
jgi:hypothetical protein